MTDPWTIVFMVVVILIVGWVGLWLLVVCLLWWSGWRRTRRFSSLFGSEEDRRHWEHVTPTNYLRPKSKNGTEEE